MFRDSGVRGRRASFARLAAALFRRVFSLLLQLVALPDRLFNAILAFGRRSLLRRSLAASRCLRRFVGQLPQRFHLLTGLRQALLQSGTTAERGLSRAGPHTHSILGHPLHRHQIRRQQRADDLGQQGIPLVAPLRTEVRQQMVVHRHAAAQPLVGKVLFRQPRQFFGHSPRRPGWRIPTTPPASADRWRRAPRPPRPRGSRTANGPGRGRRPPPTPPARHGPVRAIGPAMPNGSPPDLAGARAAAALPPMAPQRQRRPGLGASSHLCRTELDSSWSSRHRSQNDPCTIA